MLVTFTNGDHSIEIAENEYETGPEFLRLLCEKRVDSIDSCHNHTTDYAVINGITFGAGVYVIDFINTEFVNCVFADADMNPAYFTRCKFCNCKFEYSDENLTLWMNSLGLKPTTKTKAIKIKPILEPKNDQIAHDYGVKVSSLPNKSYVKIKWTCDFCHKEFSLIARRDRVGSALNERKEVPNCSKHVCNECYSLYKLSDKFYGCRTYGYAGAVKKHTTDMDASNTALIGLEMEFEGDFDGWKELQDAHKGYLHYGYDSSVVGQNELSWDCGSYSWWKYLSPLKDVCNAIKNNNGHAGDSAGIHIHVSRPDVNVQDITETINKACATGIWNAIMRAVSLRNNKELFDRYANLKSSYTTHHAGISFNSHNTCEFRIFNSSTDPALILQYIKFCKEVFNLFADNSTVLIRELPKKLSKESKKLILDCAEIQIGKDFITDEQLRTIKRILKQGD